MGADAWLLFDFRGVNPIASRVLDVHGMATRRYFVVLPASGPPVAVAHRIELQAFEQFPGEVRPYAAWRELHAALAPLVSGRTLALEVSPLDAVPYLDRVPHGVVQLLESFGAHVVSSAPLVTQFAARWSAAELAGHRRAAEAIAASPGRPSSGPGPSCPAASRCARPAVQRTVSKRSTAPDSSPIIRRSPRSPPTRPTRTTSRRPAPTAASRRAR